MTTYYRNEEGQVFSFIAELDYETQEIHGYEVLLETGEEIYRGTLRPEKLKSVKEFESDVQLFIKHMKEKMEPHRVVMS